MDKRKTGTEDDADGPARDSATRLRQFLEAWAKSQGTRGKVIPEWRFTLPPNAYQTETLVPDIAYLATYFDLPKSERTYPSIPPDITVEILSPTDRKDDVDARREFMLWWGVRLVLIADPIARTVETHESPKNSALLGEADVLTSRVFPSLALPLREIFAELDEPK